MDLYFPQGHHPPPPSLLEALIDVASAAFGPSSCQFATCLEVLEVVFAQTVKIRIQTLGDLNEMKMKSHIRDGFKMRPSCGAAYVLPPRSAQVQAPALKLGLMVSSDRGENQTGAYATSYESQSEDDQPLDHL